MSAGRLLLVLLVALAIACGRSREEGGGAPDTSARLVTVGGAVTETVFALGAGADVVAVDTSSVYPEAATKLPKVGYQRTLGAEAVLALKPTLVLATGDVGPPAVVEQLRAAGLRVVVTTAEPSVAAARERITAVARAIGRDPVPLLRQLDRELLETRALVERAQPSKPRAIVVYSRGNKAIHVLGRDTAGQAMLDLVGAENVATAIDGTKPAAPEAIAQVAPDVIVLPSRALDTLGGVEEFLTTPGIAETPAAKHRRVVAIDDLLLLGFGPRTGLGARELAEKLHGSLPSR